jgi:hypothetical protein
LKITAKMSVIVAAIFAAVCFGVAITGFSSLGDLADPVQQADARGFAWFWAFLGSVGVVFGALGIWIVKTHREEDA